MTIALDTNLLVHLLVSSSRQHDRCRVWLESVDAPLATTHTNLAEFLRLVSHPRVFERPLTLDAGVEVLARFLDEFALEVLHESDLWWRALLELGLPLRGNDVFDARIALCLRHHGVREICTLDAGFARFDFLDLIVP
jgi:toxin-antitoxin system PIN domain toxin